MTSNPSGPLPTFESFVGSRRTDEAKDIAHTEVLALLVAAFKSQQGFEVTNPRSEESGGQESASLDYAVGSLEASVCINVDEVDGKKIKGNWTANGQNEAEEELEEDSQFHWIDAGKLCKDIAKRLGHIGDEVA